MYSIVVTSINTYFQPHFIFPKLIFFSPQPPSPFPQHQPPCENLQEMITAYFMRKMMSLNGILVKLIF